MLVAGKGLGEDVTNRAAARPVAAVRDKTKGGDSQRERERGRRNRDEPEALSREGEGEGCQRAELERADPEPGVLAAGPEHRSCHGVILLNSMHGCASNGSIFIGKSNK